MRTLPLLGIALALTGCTGLYEAGTASEDLATPAPPAGILVVSPQTSAAQPYEFTTAILENGTFQHPYLDARVQATIIWWNVDDLVHSVVSDDGGFAGSGPIPQDGEFSRTFQTAGDFPYHCRYHPEMTGIVVVR